MPRLSALLALAVLAPAARAAEPTPEQLEFFEKQVRPVLVEKCVGCHGPEKQKGGLRLDTRDGALAGGDRGPALVPGKSKDSLLLRAVRHADEELKMPAAKLPDRDILALEKWVELGAPWPAKVTLAPPGDIA
ncbi:MAG TPA: c-type cytochrome domain-containing protein, partial [Gemmata sp.]|nr:c-type cytochrome domain-containing protein [Gemmata sp.]